MKIFEKSFTINYKWYRNNGEDIKPDHVEALEESAMNQIKKMLAEEYVRGQLLDNIKMDDTDGEDGVEYIGWWDLIVNLNEIP